MKQSYLHRPLVLPASETPQKPDNTNSKQEDRNAFFVAIGMRAGDMGYRHVLHAISRLGDVAHFNEGLLYLQTTMSIDLAFKRINKSIIDPRIPSDISLLILNQSQAQAKWYLNKEVSDILILHWHSESNLFVCTDNCANKQLIYDINALGLAVPISEQTWYVSTNYSPEDAYKILANAKEPGDRLTLFDAAGRIKTWQTERASITVQIEQETEDLPQHATIHTPQSWQSSMLAEFL